MLKINYNCYQVFRNKKKTILEVSEWNVNLPGTNYFFNDNSSIQCVTFIFGIILHIYIKITSTQISNAQSHSRIICLLCLNLLLDICF